jgi:phosphoglycerate kinase
MPSDLVSRLSKLSALGVAELSGKRVLVRADLNVPLKDGVIQDDTRLQAVLPTLKKLLEHGASVILMSHFGRPKGQVVEELRMDPIGAMLAGLLGQEVRKLDDCVGADVKLAAAEMVPGDVILLENTRFHEGEKKNDDAFAAELAGLADLFVNDAFGTIHRAHASTVGVAAHLPAYAGLLVEREIEVLSKVLEAPEKPVCLVMGGAKIDTKIGILQKFLGKADCFLIGGALANTFLAAEGQEIGGSLFQEDKLDVAKEFLEAVDSEIAHLPTDVIVADEISAEVEALNVGLDDVEANAKILDIGSATAELFAQKIREAGTVIWNGPMGLYEFAQFAGGTKTVAEAIAECGGETLVGGGDSIDAINKLGLDSKKFTHISTGGGAMLEFLEGKTLPGVEVLLVG